MSVIVYAGNAGDRNVRGMKGAVALGSAVARAFGRTIEPVAWPVPLIEGDWATQLKAASRNLRLLSKTLARHLDSGGRSILIMGRCAASIATLPLVARKYPEAVIVWFDAHGDCNVPGEGRAGSLNYLGGLVLSGAAGEWDTGFGGELELAKVTLVGARDLDPPERDRVNAREIGLVPVGPCLARRLEEAVAGRPVYIHLDCDVLDAGLLATEYQSPGGLSFADLHDALRTLARGEIVGLEIAEFEDCWPDGRPNPPDDLLRAIQPVVDALA